MPQMGVPKVYSDQSEIGAHNPKVVSSSLTPATMRPLGYSKRVAQRSFNRGASLHSSGRLQSPILGRLAK